VSFYQSLPHRHCKAIRALRGASIPLVPLGCVSHARSSALCINNKSACGLRHCLETALETALDRTINYCSECLDPRCDQFFLLDGKITYRHPHASTKYCDHRINTSGTWPTGSNDSRLDKGNPSYYRFSTVSTPIGKYLSNRKLGISVSIPCVPVVARASCFQSRDCRHPEPWSPISHIYGSTRIFGNRAAAMERFVCTIRLVGAMPSCSRLPLPMLGCELRAAPSGRSCIQYIGCSLSTRECPGRFAKCIRGSARAR
jgi:hypothetical protein